MPETSVCLPVVVRPGDDRVRRLLRVRADAEAALRPSSYQIRRPVEGGLLIFQTMTLELIFVPAELVPQLGAPAGALRRWLLAHWLLIPEDLDEHRTARELQETLFLMEPASDGIKKYTVLTTTACNARCFYCFEKDWKPVSMSPETADRTADYILESAASEFHIDWFGGEPLVNLRVIDRISDRLLEAGRRFTSSMFTNAYLFDEALIRRAAERWKLDSVTVTLDGCEELYNRVKAYIMPEENPFRRVIRNLHLLIEAGVQTNIRINLDEFNRGETDRLADFLIREFRPEKGLHIYASALYEEVDDPSTWRPEEVRTANCLIREALRERLAAAGLHAMGILPARMRSHQCMADSGDMVMVLPDGKLGLCEHYIRDHFIGELPGRELDREVMESFRERHPDIPACGDCPIYPLCFRLKKCVNAICYPQIRTYQENYYQSAMRNFWYYYCERQDQRNKQSQQREETT